jgi:sugar transferase EpsL
MIKALKAMAESSTTFYPAVKRGLDIIGSLTGLVVFGLPMIVIAILIYRQMGRPIFFRQTRLGRNEKPFEMLKFRSMTDKYDDQGNALPDHKRLTRLGKLLRKTSLDELPQFFNVLKGEMSLIGPRPFLPRYQGWYSSIENNRHKVRPGITGLAQVKGRNDVSWDRRMKYDLAYVRHQSFRLDCWIILATIVQILSPEGANPDGFSDANLPLDIARKRADWGT